MELDGGREEVWKFFVGTLAGVFDVRQSPACIRQGLGASAVFEPFSVVYSKYLPSFLVYIDIISIKLCIVLATICTHA